MKKTFIAYVILLISLTSAMAQVEVIVNPVEPVKDEVFDVKFKITTTSSAKPFISFTPSGLEVLEKVDTPEYHYEIRGGIGRAKTTKTIIYTYRMAAAKAGYATLRDVVVDMGGQKLTHKNVRIKVLSKRKEMPKIFARAEVSSDNVFLGEGVDVRYYVYSVNPIVQTEIKAFPKLNGFIKRFHKVNEAEEAVRINGMVYRRSLKYSARVYPEKTGKLSIDPLRVVVQYAKGSSNPFGGFGFGLGRFSKKNLNSERKEITVKPIPADNVPPTFTGLVGEHHFKLSMQKNKFVVNEAIEARLEVTGPGALEKMIAPRIYVNDALEKFDDKSEFFEVGLDQGRKVFEYTYLARANADIPKKDIIISYFDPETESFKEKIIEVPELIIGGGAISGAARPNKPVSEGSGNLENDIVFKELPLEDAMSAPLFETSWKSIPLSWVKYFLIGLIVAVIIQVIEFVRYSVLKARPKTDLKKVYNDIMKKGPTYSSVMTLVFALAPDDRVEPDVYKLIEESSLTETDKSYFKDLVKGLERDGFGEKKDDSSGLKQVRKSAFKALYKEIEDRLTSTSIIES